MESFHVVWLLAAFTGLAAAGLVGNGWALIAGRPPHIRLLAENHFHSPLRALALVIYAPLALVNAGTATVNENPVFAIFLVGFGLLWSFMQGVFILTTFFGFT